MGTSEYALRAFPLLCGVCSLLLFWAVAARLLTGWAVSFAVGLFSLGIPFIYFSSLVKQYSSDVAVALLLLLAVLHVRTRGVTPRRAGWLGLAGGTGVLFSQSALFVLAGLGAAHVLLVVMERDRPAARSLLITWFLWAAAAAAIVAHALWSVSATDREYFAWFWSDGFMPMPPQSLSDVVWPIRKLTWVFGAFAPGLGWMHGGLNYRWSGVFTVAALYGYVALWRHRRDAALFLLLPLVAVLSASALSLYPFTARLAAFLTPSLLLATAAGAADALTRVPSRLAFLSPAALAILGGAPLYAVATALPPTWVQHVRPVLEQVRDRLEAGDRVYVFYGASLAARYYAPRLGIPREPLVYGRCWLADPRGYLRELDTFRGDRRAWIVLTHLQREQERALLLDYLQRIGRRVEGVAIPGTRGRMIEDAEAHLFDLSDPKRLASAAADTHPVALEPVTAVLARWGCHGITGSEPERSPAPSQ